MERLRARVRTTWSARRRRPLRCKRVLAGDRASRCRTDPKDFVQSLADTQRQALKRILAAWDDDLYREMFGHLPNPDCLCDDCEGVYCDTCHEQRKQSSGLF